MANRYIKGLNKDTSPIDQIEGTWRHAKNVVMNTIKGGISNEKGFTHNSEDHRVNLNINIGSLTDDGWESTGFDLSPGDDGPTSNADAAKPKMRQRGGERIIGKIEISDGRVVLFTTKKQTELSDESWENGVGKDHAIYLLNNDNKLELVFRTLNAGKVLQTVGEDDFIYYVNLQVGGTKAFDLSVGFLNIVETGLTYDINADLNFDIEHPIEGTYKINSKGELIVYWTDDFNPPRSLNITRQLDTASYTSVTDPNTPVELNEVNDSNHIHYYANHIYGKLIYNVNINEFTVNKDYIDRLNLFPHSGPVPHVDFKTINSGGGLATGTYQLAIAYADLNFTRTNYLTVSNPVYITEELENVTPIERYDGSNAGTQTGKSITWQVSNINTDYDYIRAVIVRTLNGQEEAFQLKDIPIKNVSTIEYITYTGIESTTSGTVAEIMIDTVSYSKAKTINQLDNILYLGNLEGSKDLDYQKYANNIKLEATTELIEKFDPFETSVDNLNFGYSVKTKPFLEHTDSPTFDPDFYGIQRGYRSALYNVMKKGYTRDEVYAFYIAFILNDGTMSYAYHIPGREELEDGYYVAPEKGVADAQYVKETDFILGTSIPDQIDGWLDTCGYANPEYNNQWGHFPKDMQDKDLYSLSGGQGRAFHFFDFSDHQDANNMNYWQNANEFYPSTENYDVWDETGQIDTLRGKHVRHHHFPSNENRDFWVFKDYATNTVSWNNHVQTGVPSSSYQQFAASEYDSGLSGETPQTITATWTGMYPGQWDQISSGMGTPSGSTKQIILADAGQDYATPPVWNGPVPPEGTCIYCEVTEGGPTGNILEDQGTDGNGVDIGTNCNAWFYGTVTDNSNYNGGLKIDIGDSFNNCNCSNSSIWDDAINPCGTPENTDAVTFSNPDAITNLCGCAGGGILDGQNTTTLNYDTAGFGGDIGDRNATTKYSGTCRWEVNSFLTQFQYLEGGDYGQPTDTYAGTYTTFDLQILGFHLNQIYIPEEIKEQVQGFRVYYAKREHHNRRVLGQSLGVPMRQLNTPVIAGCMQTENTDLGSTVSSNAFLYGPTLANNSQLQNVKPMWVCEGFPRNRIDFFDNTGWVWPENGTSVLYGSSPNERVHSHLCSWSGVQFHDFYLLNNKHSISHATHMKIESLMVGLSYFSKQLSPYDPVNIYAPDGTHTAVLLNDDSALTDTGEDADETVDLATCHSEIFRGSLQVPIHYAARNGFEHLTGGMLNFPIAENAKTYLRGDSIYEGAGDIGFGYSIYNVDGESSMAFRLLAKRGLPPVYEGDYDIDNATSSLDFYDPNGTTNHGPNSKYCYNQFTGTTSDYSVVFNPNFPYSGQGLNIMTYTGDIPIAIDSDAGGKGTELVDRKPEVSALWQTNLHAFKLDLYNSLDANELVWTGYEIIGDDFQNMNYEDGTKISYPDGIFGGDTFLCYNNFRTSNRSVFSLVGDSDSGDLLGWPNEMKDNRWPEYNKTDNINTLYSTIVESTDNINFRHSGNRTNHADAYFPKTPAQTLLRLDLTLDLTYNPDPETGNIRYNEDYSKLNTLKTAIPLPTGISEPTTFPTRVVRSVKADGTSLVDNYRMFLALQFKDLPKNRGDLISLAGMNNILYMHMEDTIYATKGKETLELTDGSEAFVGSGDIFEKDPEEVIQTYYGYGGTQSQFAGITTRAGYFFLNYADRRVFLLTDNLAEISGLGMESWFKKNIPFKFEDYPGWNFSGPQTFGTFNLDNPFSNFGFTSTWDPVAKRILLTKKEIRPTKLFDYMYKQEDGFGWSLTYNPANGTYTRDANLPLEMISCFTPDTFSDATSNILAQPFDLQSDNAFTNSLFWFELPDNIGGAWDGNGAITGIPCNTMFLGDQADSLAFSPNKVCFDQEDSNDCTLSSFDLDDEQLESENPNAIYDFDNNRCCLVFGQDFKAKLVKRTGWTISFYPELQIWVSFHNYIPSVYILSGETLMSGNFHEDKLYVHHDGQFGQFEYGFFSDQTSWEETEEDLALFIEQETIPTIYSSIIEVIHAESKNENKTFANVSYTVDVSTATESGQTANRHDSGFTSFYVYNTHQLSEETDLTYLTNIRRIGNDWKINQFRDMANLNANDDGLNNELVNMFTISGMDKSINLEYLDVNKDETTQRKFVDKFLGICLKNSNISNNLVTLYSTQVGLRKYFR